jgi:hypothetical protein
MHLDLRDSITLITGTDPNRFGTGFAIHRDERYAYLLTCQHVVDDVGGPKGVKVDGNDATVICSDSAAGFDLAVLRVEKALRIPLLSLGMTGEKGRCFSTAGFYLFGNKTLCRKFRGTLEEEVRQESKELGSGTAWYLKSESGYKLESGYSGAPVFDETTNTVLGVISLRQGEGEVGLAISIDALRKLWRGMPDGLFVDLEKARVMAAPLVKEPMMNLLEELAGFEKIATRGDTQTRLILVNGESGMGKTYLLDLYRRVAAANDLEYLDFALGQQISIQECIDRIVCYLGVEYFSSYDGYRSGGLPQPFNRLDEEEWHRTLTRKFFMDLRTYSKPSPLVVFFDQYEKADPAFKSWLTEVFLTNISPRNPLIVVITGQEEIKLLPSVKGFRHFPLVGVTVDWYFRYVEDCKIDLDPTKIFDFHEVLRGRPKEFVEYVKLRLPAGAAG